MPQKRPEGIKRQPLGADLRQSLNPQAAVGAPLRNDPDAGEASGRPQRLQLYLMADVKIPEKVNADKFDAILKRLIKNKPLPKKALEGKRKGKKKLKTVL